MRNDQKMKLVQLWRMWAVMLAMVFVFPAMANAQVAQQESAIQAIRDAGGRAAPISAVDEELDVGFHLSDQAIGDDQLKLLKALPKIRWLNLANTKITDQGLAEIAGLTGLTKLHLEKTEIGDKGVAHLKGLSQLKYLNLYGTQVGDEGLQQLAGLKNLKQLYVWQSKVTEAGIQQLHEKLPDLTIIGELKLAPIAKPDSADKQNGEEKKKGEEGDQQKSSDKKDDDLS